MELLDFIKTMWLLLCSDWKEATKGEYNVASDRRELLAVVTGGTARTCLIAHTVIFYRILESISKLPQKLISHAHANTHRHPVISLISLMRSFHLLSTRHTPTKRASENVFILWTLQ
jgi:hypothetical protein